MLSRLMLTAVLVATPAAPLFAQGTPQQRAACRPDVVKFCKGKNEDPGVILTCLQDNKAKISERCRKVIAEADEPITPASTQKKDDKPADPSASAEKKDEKK